MKLTRPQLLVSLLAIPWAAGVGAHTTGCNADNCLRALRNPTRAAAATSFCHSYTAANVTATTGLPTQFATPCGSGPTQSVRLSSACSCYVPPPVPTCTADTNTDNNNCGSCGNVCAPGTTCQSGTCTTPIPDPEPGNCTSYTISCSEVINGILEENSIASPDLVDYRIQTALEELTSASDFLSALGPELCDDPELELTDPEEYASCLEQVGNPTYIAQLAEITRQFLTAFQTCASKFADGEPDYQVIVNDTASCTSSNSFRRRASPINAEHDITATILDAIRYSRRSADLPILGAMKPFPPSTDLIQLVRRQASTCRGTADCFETCPDCKNQQTYCGTASSVITPLVCKGLSVAVGAGARALAATACAALCGPTPASPVCAVTCAKIAGKIVGKAVNKGCKELKNYICDGLTDKCTTCNNANGDVCNPNTSQCCPGETGTQCGAGCCCCPRCQAPGGPTCACLPAAC